MKADARLIQHAQGKAPQVLTRIHEEGVNMAVWQRALPVHIADFCALLLSLDEPLAHALSFELPDENTPPNLQGWRSDSATWKAIRASWQMFAG